jgi:hypothetical protein
MRSTGRCANSRKAFLLLYRPYDHHLTSHTNGISDACKHHGVYTVMAKVCSDVCAARKVWPRTQAAKSFRTILIRSSFGTLPIMHYNKFVEMKRGTVPFSLYKYRSTGGLRLRLKLKLKLEALSLSLRLRFRVCPMKAKHAEALAAICPSLAFQTNMSNTTR